MEEYKPNVIRIVGLKIQQGHARLQGPSCTAQVHDCNILIMILDVCLQFKQCL